MEKINIAKLLKDCPKGMELDCTLYEDVTLFCASDSGVYPIKIETPDGLVSLDKYGGYSSNNLAKCIIFPKGTTTWEGFVPPCLFKDGDVVVTLTNVNTWISIFKGCYVDEYYTYVDIGVDSYCFLCNTSSLVNRRKIVEQRLATEDEKQKLFDAIKENGYKWNAETKTLDKLAQPKFKVGDDIRIKGTSAIYVVTDIREDCYMLDDKDISLQFKTQDQWELVPNKFDITTFKPFDKVLARDYNYGIWKVFF